MRARVLWAAAILTCTALVVGIWLLTRWASREDLKGSAPSKRAVSGAEPVEPVKVEIRRGEYPEHVIELRRER